MEESQPQMGSTQEKGMWKGRELANLEAAWTGPLLWRVCVYLSRSESPEARGWHGQVTFNFLCPSSKPEPKHRHINSESTVQTALKAKQVYWLELPDSRGAEVATEARSRRKGRGRRDPFWMLAERKLKRATAEPFFRYSKFKLFK